MKELSIRDKRLFEVMKSELVDHLNETLLDECAELDYRLCLVELGIN